LKALLIAGGNGTRLAPNTIAVNKHLLPVFDKPLIYYSLSTLMLSGISDIRLIARSADLDAFSRLLGDGSQFGISLTYGIQDEPKGIPDTIKVSKDYIAGDEFALALGDNVFFGSGLSGALGTLVNFGSGARILLKQVSDPERFGVAWVGPDGLVEEIREKPSSPTSNLAITGLYYLPGDAVDLADGLVPSSRGELEITDLLRAYMPDNNLHSWSLPRGTMWLDTGTIESLMDASNFVRSFQALSGQLIGSPHEVAWRNQWIDDAQLASISERFPTSYGSSLLKLLG
jgi:glucose-1-phosphate thymidylyltransferase